MVKEIDEKNYLEERGHDEILERNFFPDENFINARIISEKSMFIEESNTKGSSNDFKTISSNLLIWRNHSNLLQNYNIFFVVLEKKRNYFYTNDI